VTRVTTLEDRPQARQVPRVDHIVAQKLYAGLEATSPTVVACEAGRGHRWTDIVVTYERSGIEGLDEVPVTFCARCYVRRCDAGVQIADPASVCLYPVHHSRAHRDSEGKWREVGK
jgi:hypothetical protein